MMPKDTREYVAVVKRVMAIPKQLARDQIARDGRPLSQRIGSDIYVLMDSESQSQLWLEAYRRLLLEIQEIAELEKE